MMLGALSGCHDLVENSLECDGLMQARMGVPAGTFCFLVRYLTALG
jgi:hypothetical protein